MDLYTPCVRMQSFAHIRVHPLIAHIRVHPFAFLFLIGRSNLINKRMHPCQAPTQVTARRDSTPSASWRLEHVAPRWCTSPRRHQAYTLCAILGLEPFFLSASHRTTAATMQLITAVTPCCCRLVHRDAYNKKKTIASSFSISKRKVIVIIFYATWPWRGSIVALSCKRISSKR